MATEVSNGRLKGKDASLGRYEANKSTFTTSAIFGLGQQIGMADGGIDVGIALAGEDRHGAPLVRRTCASRPAASIGADPNY